MVWYEEIMIVGRTMGTQSTSVTDGRTDRQNYDTKTVQRIALHGKNINVLYGIVGYFTAVSRGLRCYCMPLVVKLFEFT